MILKVAWRNIWRNKLRSMVVIIAIALGLWAGLFASAFVVGMMNQKIESVIEKELSHFQFHHPDFRDDLKLADTLNNVSEIIQKLEQDENVRGTSTRLVAFSMMQSANKSGSLMGKPSIDFVPASPAFSWWLVVTVMPKSWPAPR